MTTYIETYIIARLKEAEYEFDPETNCWCASVPTLPGVYAQSQALEDTRQELAEVIEEYIFVSLSKEHKLPGFSAFNTLAHA